MDVRAKVLKANMLESLKFSVNFLLLCDSVLVTLSPTRQFIGLLYMFIKPYFISRSP